MKQNQHCDVENSKSCFTKENDQYLIHGNMYIVSITNVYLLFGYHSPAPCELCTLIWPILNSHWARVLYWSRQSREIFLCSGLVFRYYLHVVILDFDFIKYRTHFYPCMLCAKFNLFGQILYWEVILLLRYHPPLKLSLSQFEWARIISSCLMEIITVVVQKKTSKMLKKLIVTTKRQHIYRFKSTIFVHCKWQYKLLVK